MSLNKTWAVKTVWTRKEKWKSEQFFLHPNIFLCSFSIWPQEVTTGQGNHKTRFKKSKLKGKLISADRSSCQDMTISIMRIYGNKLITQIFYFVSFDILLSNNWPLTSTCCTIVITNCVQVNSTARLCQSTKYEIYEHVKVIIRVVGMKDSDKNNKLKETMVTLRWRLMTDVSDTCLQFIYLFKLNLL